MMNSAVTATDVVVCEEPSRRCASTFEDERLGDNCGEEELPPFPHQPAARATGRPSLPGSFSPTSFFRRASALPNTEAGPSVAKPRAFIVHEVQAVMRRYLTGDTHGSTQSSKGKSKPKSKSKKLMGQGDIFKHVLGIVNPGSGENAAAEMVADAMRSHIGAHRVLLLTREVFRDPSGLRKLLKQFAVVYFSPINGANMDDVVRDEEETAARAERRARRTRQSKRRKRRWGLGRARGSRSSSRSDNNSSSASCSSNSSRSSSTHSRSSSNSSNNSRHSGSSFQRHSTRCGAKGTSQSRRRRPVIPEKVDTAEMRGTVFVSGGDGTMAFILDQVEKVRLELQGELRVHSLQELIPGQHRPHDHTTGAAPADATPGAPTRRLFATPAVAPIPLGTGNDFSNCLGFGSGFTKRRQGVAGWLCCANTDVGQLLAHAAAAPAVPFDRWRASFVPLRIAQRHYSTAEPHGAGLSVVSRDGDDAVGEHAGEALAMGGSLLRSTGPDDSPNGSPTSLIMRSSQGMMPSGSVPSLAASHVNSGALANRVHNVDWETIQRGNADGEPLCKSYGIINYLSIGFDAYVVCKFDETRRKYPQLCSTRAQNKAVYGIMGLRGSIKCKSTRKLMPMVCIPRPSPTLHTAVGAGTGTIDGPRADLAAAAKPDMVALSIPEMARALVMTNVNSYSAGAHPWDPLDPEVFYEPIVGIRDTNVLTAMPGKPHPVATPVASSSSFFSASLRTNPTHPARASQTDLATQPSLLASTIASHHRLSHTFGEEESLPVITPVAVNDRRFEVQAMGGVWHYGAMGAGLTSAVKMAQPSEMFMFVLCTPEDLALPEGQTSLFTQTRLKGYEARIPDDLSVQASLYAQVDGEALPMIDEPTIVHVEPIAAERVFVRCTNTEVVWQKNAHYRALVEEAIQEQADE